MIDIPSSEAIALLSGPLLCEDAPDWTYNKLRPGLVAMECGLVQENGSRAGMHVQLMFSRSAKTGICSIKFTVFKMSLGGHQRVYQLHVSPTLHAPKNWHDFAHEHMGDDRIIGSKDWLKWSFTDALDYFCQRANITFEPPLVDPEIFELTP